MEGADYAQTNRGRTLHCINLPAMFQYNTSGFIVEAGPQIGILVSAKENGRDATDGYENVNIALGMGAAYRMKQGLGFNARYNLGLTGITKNDSQDAKLTSNVMQLGFTFSVANIKRRK